MKFRLAELLIVVSVVGFACVALKQASPLFETLFFSFTLGLALISVLMAIGRTAEKRVYWLGFAITLIPYLLFATAEDRNGIAPRHDGPEITTQLLRLSFNWIHGGEYENGYESDPAFGGGFFSVEDKLGADEDSEPIVQGDDSIEEQNTVVPFSSNLSIVVAGGQQVHDDQHLIADGRSISFMCVGHCLWGLAIGWLARHFTQATYLRSRPSATKRDQARLRCKRWPRSVCASCCGGSLR